MRSGTRSSRVRFPSTRSCPSPRRRRDRPGGPASCASSPSGRPTPPPRRSSTSRAWMPSSPATSPTTASTSGWRRPTTRSECSGSPASRRSRRSSPRSSSPATSARTRAMTTRPPSWATPRPTSGTSTERLSESHSAQELVDKMMVLHGDLGNPYTLWTAAQGVFEQGQGASSCAGSGPQPARGSGEFATGRVRMGSGGTGWRCRPRRGGRSAPAAPPGHGRRPAAGGRRRSRGCAGRRAAALDGRGWGRRRSPQGHGNPGIWRVASALCQVTGRSEGYLRFVEGVVAMATEVKTTGRPDSGQAIARRAGGDRPSSARDDTPPQAVA